MRFVLSANFREKTGEIVLESVSRDDLPAREPSSELGERSYSSALLQFFTALGLYLWNNQEARVDAEESPAHESEAAGKKPNAGKKSKPAGRIQTTGGFTFPPAESQDIDASEISKGAPEVRESLNQLNRNARRERAGAARKARGRATERVADTEREPHWARDFLWIAKDVPVLAFPRGKKDSVRLSAAVVDPEVIIKLSPKPIDGSGQLDGPDQLRAFLRLLALLRDPAGCEMLRYHGIRENLRYQVEFTDIVPYDRLHERFKSTAYHYYKSSITFERISPRHLDTFIIAIESSRSDAKDSIGQHRVIDREVIDFDENDNDKDAFTKVFASAIKATSSEERLELLSPAAKVCATVNGEQALLESVTKVELGYHLEFALPPRCRGQLMLKFDLEVFGFQPRSACRFPMVIIEPTRKATFMFDYQQAAIENVDHFVGACVAPTGALTKGVVDDVHRQFWLNRSRDEFFSPGEGAVVFWTPVQFIDRIDLVELGKFDTRLSIQSPYVTESNWLGKKLHPANRLFLVKQTAEKLRAVQDALDRDESGFVLKIRDGYRPPAVQRQMLDQLKHKREQAADPPNGSLHSRGCAVDVTLALRDGNNVAMPTKYPDFSESAHVKTIMELDTPAAKNFKTLLHCMHEAGFEVHPTEWWHFTDKDWRKYPIINFEAYENMLTSLAAEPPS